MQEELHVLIPLPLLSSQGHAGTVIGLDPTAITATFDMASSDPLPSCFSDLVMVKETDWGTWPAFIINRRMDTKDGSTKVALLGLPHVLVVDDSKLVDFREVGILSP